MNVIFDFDGTIANTMPGLERIGVAVIKQYYQVQERVARDRYRRTIGAPFDVQLVQAFGPHPKMEHAARHFAYLKERLYAYAKPFPSVPHVLDVLRKQGRRSSIVSSTDSRLVKWFVEKHQLQVADIAGNERGDDKAAQIRMLVNAHGPALFVGDALRDEVYAREANVPFLGVTGTFSWEHFTERGLPCVGKLEGVLFHGA